MVITMLAHEFSRNGCDLIWQMSEKTSRREVARGKSGIVFMDYTNRKIAPVPESFRQQAAHLPTHATLAAAIPTLPDGL